MIKEINLKEKTIKYDFQQKNVKNINLRIKYDGTICVSANRRATQRDIDVFLRSKEDFILKALEKCAEKNNEPCCEYFSQDEIRDVILKLCEKVYPYFKERSVKFPMIKFRRMVSQWGNCHYQKGVLTFNLNLMYAPKECVEYVVVHEFTHFLHPNHSKRFYDEMAKILPDWKCRRQKLKEISLRGLAD